MAWTINYSNTAKKQLRKLDKSTALKILRYLDDRVTHKPRSSGISLEGSLGELRRYRIGDTLVMCRIQDIKNSILVVKLGNERMPKPDYASTTQRA